MRYEPPVVSRPRLRLRQSPDKPQWIDSFEASFRWFLGATNQTGGPARANPTNCTELAGREIHASLPVLWIIGIDEFGASQRGAR